LSAALVVASGCGPRLVDACAGLSGTCLAVQVRSTSIARVDLLDLRVEGDQLDLEQQIGEGGSFSLPFAIGAQFTSLPHSPLDLKVTVTAIQGGRTIGSGSSTVPMFATGKHQSASVWLQSGSGEGDMGFPVSVPRLIAPLSTSTVSSTRPTMRWVLSPGVGAPVVDLCADRLCQRSLGIPAQVRDNTLAIPGSSLPAGLVYWRVRVVNGDQTATSPVWYFRVGPASASVDTSAGDVLDVNGDGRPEVLVGAPGGNIANLFLGGAAPPFSLHVDLRAPDAKVPRFGQAVASAGDVNGDGYGDFLVGADGAVSLYFGEGAVQPGKSLQRIDLVSPDQAGSLFGRSVASAGDVNGDGYADFLVAAPQAQSGAGAVHVYLGSGAPSLTGWNGPSPSQRIDLGSPDSKQLSYGMSLAAAGDVDGDGVGDFLVGADGTNFGNGAGFAHLYLGRAPLDASDWQGAAHLRRVDLVSPDGDNAYFGDALAGVGDVDGDGLSDFVVAGPYAAQSAGGAWLYLGGGASHPDDWNGAAHPRRIDLVSPDGADSGFASAVAAAGDVDGDGHADLLVSAFNSGAVHVYLGSAFASPDDWNGATHPRRIDLASPDGSGLAFVRGAGDFDGDGFGDFLSTSNGGNVYLYLGGATPAASDWNGRTSAKRVVVPNPDGASSTFGTL
jgi:hypothetical protein